MFIDAHAHLDGYAEIGAAALDSAVEEIVRHRIFTISNSMDVPSYQKNREVAARTPWVLAAFGVHPWNAPDYVGRLGELREAMAESPLFGEIGLDHFFIKDSSRYAAQEKVFQFFLSAARGRNKVVIIHTKGAERDVLDALDRYGTLRVVVHWYSGSLEIFRELAGRGCYFTIGPEILRSKHIRAIAGEIAEDRLLTETDNPGGSGGVLGKTGTPLLIQDVVRELAAVRGLGEEDLGRRVCSNLLSLFGEDTRLAESKAFLVQMS